MSSPEDRLAKLEAEVLALRERVVALKETKRNLGVRLQQRDEEIRRLRTAGRTQSRSPKKRLDPFDHLHGVDYVRNVLETKETPRVSQDQLRRFERELQGATDGAIAALFPRDPMLSNFVRNLWEWGNGRTELTSLPWNISLPISDVCNARCTFCTSWLDGRQQLTLEQLEKFEPVLRTAIYVGLIGHGEPMSHPRLAEIADRLQDYLDPRAASYTITNGVYLPKWIDRLDDLRLSTISCSLNAATPETHQTVMGFDPIQFPRIVESLRVIASGKASKRPIGVSITLVVTQQNIHEIPAFIELGNGIGARSIYLRTLLPQPQPVEGLNYHLLPPYLHPDFERLQANAIAAMKESPIPVHAEPTTWGTPVFPEAMTSKINSNPPTVISRADALRNDARDRNQVSYITVRKLRGELSADPTFADNLKDDSNPHDRRAPFRCRAVYNNLYVNELFLRVSPCCYLTNTPGHDEIRLMDMGDIVEAWNASSLQTLRHRLAEGPLYGACERCPESW
jgi:sulfatase maturation enzyme AslB (radical SAM superfamily)